MREQRIVALDDVDPMASPYFSMIVIPGQRWNG
jgi:precorrin-2/cobalt-factor-2 C20-methyltransferase